MNGTQPWPQFLIQQIPFWIITVAVVVVLVAVWREHRSKHK